LSIPLVRVLIINVGSGFAIKNLNFSFLGSVFQYCLLGLNGVSIEVRIKLPKKKKKVIFVCVFFIKRHKFMLFAPFGIKRHKTNILYL
jgi:hypothetical protein